MKILLYEPGDTGHRPVILRYTIKILTQYGIDWVHENRNLNSRELVKAAQKAKCNVIYILTLDGLAWFAWKVSWWAKLHKIRIIAIYYLFNNLAEGWKSWIWRCIFFTGWIDTVFISDECLKIDARKYPKEVQYLPDPWDPDEFLYWSQEDARRKLTLPVSTVIFLMFGMINERKGADLLLRAIGKIKNNFISDEVVFLLVGKTTDAIQKLYDELAIELPKNIKCYLIDKHVEESDVSAYFYAADYIINAYPYWFKVSSGAVTRALAAARPIIVPSHGINSELTNDDRCGYNFTTDDGEALATILLLAFKNKKLHEDIWFKQCKQSGENGEKRTIFYYATSFFNHFIINKK